MQTITEVAAGKSFDDICRDRIGSLPQLTPELESFECGKLFDCQNMQLDEKVVGALPRNE
jgi:hypothetical protein